MTESASGCACGRPVAPLCGHGDAVACSCAHTRAAVGAGRQGRKMAAPEGEAARSTPAIHQGPRFPGSLVWAHIKQAMAERAARRQKPRPGANSLPDLLSESLRLGAGTHQRPRRSLMLRDTATQPCQGTDVAVIGARGTAQAPAHARIEHRYSTEAPSWLALESPVSCLAPLQPSSPALSRCSSRTRVCCWWGCWPSSSSSKRAKQIHTESHTHIYAQAMDGRHMH